MCGIFGIFNPSGGLTAQDISRRLVRITHRGPDGEGHYLCADRTCGLGHRRLAIVELSDLGKQPMRSASGRYHITYNGEIYNFLELRETLEAAGYRFRGGSDTEVLLAAYEHWGTDMLPRLDGMFAFCILETDASDRPVKLLLARDRAGEKPLFCSNKDGRFEFGSDVSLLEDCGGPDPDGMNCYLALGYILPGLSFFREVFQIRPGHMLEVDVSGGGPAIVGSQQAWWSLPDGWDGINRTAEELAEEIEPIFIDAVRRRLISDVPVGIFLSGGLDSSLVAAAASATSSRPKTFNISFPGAGSFDESHLARQIAEHFGTEHYEIDGREFSQMPVDPLFKSFLDPLADSSLIPMYYVSKAAREVATVALGGDGGDELFGGYSAYSRALKFSHALRHVPDPFVKSAAAAARFLPAGFRGKAMLEAFRFGRDGFRVAYSAYFGREARKDLIDTGGIGDLSRDIDFPGQERLRHALKGQTLIEGMTRMDFATYLPGDILTKVDRASMACSLEVRAPWLDPRIIEFCFTRIPPHLRATAKNTRVVQKALARRMLPADFEIDRKQGFSLPPKKLSRTLSQELLAAPDVSGLRTDGVRKLAAAGQAKPLSLSGQLAAVAFLKRQQASR